jgi:succinate-acetate transporter protein
MPSLWSDEGEIRPGAPREKVREAELWRDATIATPVPLGLAALSTATFIWGIVMAFRMAVIAAVPVIFVIGGITLWTMALFALRKGSTFTATFFGIVGSFNISWAVYAVYAAMFLPAGQAVTIAPMLALLQFLTAFVLAYLWLSSFQVNTALMLTILTLFISYVLVGIGLMTGGVLLAVGGWFAVASAIIGYYTSFAIIFNSVAHKAQVPLGTKEYAEEAHEHA